MKRQPVICLLASFLFLTAFSTSRAEVEMSTLQHWTVEGTPIDVAVSLNGRRIYVLTDQRDILVYSPIGSVYNKFSVDQSIDGIRIGLNDDILFLTSRKNKMVRMVTLDFIQNIDVSGSPFRGPADAPVVIAVYSDYQ